MKQGRFQNFLQGVAEISSGSGENFTGGGKIISRSPLSLGVFAFLHNITNLRTLFDILEIHKLYFKHFFWSFFYLLYTQAWFPATS